MQSDGGRHRAALLGAALVAVFLAGCVDSDTAPAEPGALAPDFTVTTIDGETFTLSQKQGQVVLVYFMGIGCSSCAWNLAHHQSLWDAHGGYPRFSMIALNSWATQGIPGESDSDMREYRDREGIGWPLAAAPARTVNDYGVRGTPTHVFIDSKGEVGAQKGAAAFDTLNAEVSRLLDEIQD